MKKFLALTLVACSGLLVSAGVSQAGRRGCCCSAPAAPAVVVPAPLPATAAAPQGVRSYSYQPETTSDYGNFIRNWVGGHSYQNATNKALGRVN